MRDGLESEAPAPAAAWHSLSIGDAFARLRAGQSGLASDDAAQRLATYGPNELRATIRTPVWRTFAAQFENVLILILLAATAVSGFLGHTLEAVVITVIVCFAVLLGFIQELSLIHI